MLIGSLYYGYFRFGPCVFKSFVCSLSFSTMFHFVPPCHLNNGTQKKKKSNLFSFLFLHFLGNQTQQFDTFLVTKHSNLKIPTKIKPFTKIKPQHPPPPSPQTQILIAVFLL